MKFNIFLGKEYEHTHEREIFERFAQDLYDKWETEATGILFGNVSIGGIDIDAMVLKTDSIILIDFKAQGGNINFSENGPWINEDGKEIKGGNALNPFDQMKKNKRRVMDFLIKYPEIFVNNKPNWGHIKGFIISHEEIYVLNEDKMPGTIKSWFRIMSYNESFSAVNNAATTGIKLSDDEIDKLKNIIGYSKEILPEQLNRDVLHDENMMDALFELYILKKQKELIKEIEKIDKCELKIKKYTDQVSRELEIFIDSKNRMNAIANKEYSKKLVDQYFNRIDEIIELGGIPKEKLDGLSAEKRLRLTDRYSKYPYLEGNLPHDKQSEIVKPIADYLLNVGKYKENVYVYLMTYLFKHSNKTKLVPLLMDLGKFVNKFHSEIILSKERNGTVKIGNDIDRIEKIILQFKPNCDISYFDLRYKKIWPKGSKDFEYHLDGYILPKRLFEIQNRIIDGIKECFLDQNDYKIFERLAGLQFLKSNYIKFDNFDVVETGHGHILSTGVINDLLLINSDVNFILFHLVLFEQLDKFSLRAIYGITPSMCSEKSELHDLIDEMINEFKNIDKELFASPQSVNFAYLGMLNKYTRTYSSMYLPLEILCTEALRLSNDIEDTFNFSSLDGKLLRKINSMSISNNLHIKLSKKFIKDVEKEIVAKKERERNEKENNDKKNFQFKKVEETTKPLQPNKENTYNEPIDTEEFLFGYDDIKAFIRKHLKSIQDPKIKELIKIGNPDGIILYGPPGCGKTFFAQWIAKELNFEFNEVPKSKFSSPYVDGGLIELTKVLEEIKKKKNQVVFFDEFDSVAIKRNKGNIHNESLKIVNSLLQEIPKIIESGNLVIAATNYLENLDDAVIRSGRFGLKIPIFPPLANERAFILKNLVLNLINDEVEFKPYVEFKIAAETDWWINQTKEMYLYSNSDLVSLAHKILTYFTETFRNEKEYTIKALNEIKGSKPNCKALLDFLKEIEENIPEGLEKRFEEFSNELAKKGCIKNGKNTKSVGYKYNKKD